jgi:hypothetical protein
MTFISLPGITCWGNLHRPCQAPLAPLHRRGEVWQRTWPSPLVPRLLQHEVSRASRFLVRPQLLTLI